MREHGKYISIALFYFPLPKGDKPINFKQRPSFGAGGEKGFVVGRSVSHHRFLGTDNLTTTNTYTTNLLSDYNNGDNNDSSNSTSNTSADGCAILCSDRPTALGCLAATASLRVIINTGYISALIRCSGGNIVHRNLTAG